MKSKIALITLALVASATASAHGVTAGATGSNVINSNSASSAVASGTGSALSSAYNQGQAINSVTVGGSVSGNYGVETFNADKTVRTTVDTSAGAVNVEGFTLTRNISGATTSQTGNAIAGAGASGSAVSTNSGSGAFHTIGNGPAGNVSGNSNASTQTGVGSIGNGNAVQNAGMTAEFQAGASADLTSTTVQNGSMKNNVPGLPFLGQHFSPTNTGTSTDVKNASTNTLANAYSNGGYTTGTGSAATPIANVSTGFAGGYTSNLGSAAGLANSSVKGQVSASK